MSVMPIKASSLANLRNTILYHALGSGITTKRHDLTQEIKFLLCNEDREADLSDDATMKAFDDYFYGLWYFNQAACVLRDKGVEVLPAYSSDTMRQLYENEMERVRPQIQVVSPCQVLKTLMCYECNTSIITCFHGDELETYNALIVLACKVYSKTTSLKNIYSKVIIETLPEFEQAKWG